MCEAKEEEDWCVEDPNEEWFNPMKWRKGTWMPEGKVILELFERLKKEKILELKWKCPGRRPPETERQEEEMELTENPDNDQEEEEKQDEKPTSFGEFEFDDASEASTKITPRRTPGTGKSPRPQKRVARMDNILNDIMRQRKQNQAANKTLGVKVRRNPIYSNAASPKFRPGLGSSPGSSAPKPLTTDPCSSSVFSTSSTPTNTAFTSTTVFIDTDQSGSKGVLPAYSAPWAPTSVVPPVPVSSPGPKKPAHSPAPSQTRENQAVVPPFNPGSALSSASVRPGTPARIQNNVAGAPPPVPHAGQSRAKTPPSSQIGPAAPQTVPKLLLKIPPSNQHPFISNKSEQLGYSAGRKTPPVSHAGQRTPPVYQNTPKTPPIHPKSPKTPPAYHNTMQNAPKASTAYQNAPKAPPVYQAAPRTPPVYQAAPRTPPVYQAAPRTPPVFQNAPKTPPGYQNAPKTPPFSQNAPKTPPAYHNPPKTPPVYQNAPKTPPVYQSTPKTPPVYQNTPKTPPVYQSAPKTPPSFQNAPRTPPISQAALMSPPSFQSAPKTPPAYQNVPNMSPPYHGGPKTPPSYQNVPKGPSGHQNTTKTPATYQNNSRISASFHNSSKTPPPYHTVMSRGPPVSTGISVTRTFSQAVVRPAYSGLGAGLRTPMTTSHFVGNVPTNLGVPRTLSAGMRPPPAHTAVSMTSGENFQLPPSVINNLSRLPNTAQLFTRPPMTSPSGPSIVSTAPNSIQGPQPGIRGHPSGKTQPSGVTSVSRDAT